MAEPITVRLTKGKETKGTFRFEAEDAEAVVTALYVRKSAFAGSAVPKTVELQLHEV